MTTSELSNLFRLSHYAINVNLEGFTHEESLVPPPGGGNCLNWVLGHIVGSRNQILAQVGEEPALHPAVAERYKRGSDPIRTARDAAPLDLLYKAFQDSQDRLLARLGGMSDADLDLSAGDVAGGDKTVGQALAFAHFHETYHAGQVGVLRRLAGKPGQIR